MSPQPTITIAGKVLGATGYGLMSLTAKPANPMPYPEAAKIMKAALDQGANFWNGGMFYGPPNANSLQLLKYYFTEHPEDANKVILSIKGAYDFTTHLPTGSPEAIRASVEEALRVLDGVKKVDIFEMARVDPEVKLETSIKALAELVAEGKIGGIGLSEVSAATIRRAHAVHPIAAVENELSFFTTDSLTNGVLETCHELGIAFVAYSPLSRGLISSKMRKPSDVPENDIRRTFMPRFSAEVFEENFKLVEAVEGIAEKKGVTVAQVAIAWVRYQGAFPIPSATTTERLLENTKVVELSAGELEEIAKILGKFEIKGGRYPEHFTKFLDQ